MNAENFVEFLKDYSKLYQLSYEELKSLAMQYPYCANLHYLLLEKSQLEQHKELDQNLKTASFYSQDRAALRALMLELEELVEPVENFDLAEDYLELKDLSTLEARPESNIAEESTPQEETKTEHYPEPPLHGEHKASSPLPEQAGDGLEEIFNALMSDYPANATEEIQEEEPVSDSKTHLPEQKDESSADKEEAALLPSESEEEPASPAMDNPTEEPLLKSETMETPENFPQAPSGKPRPTPKTSFSSWVQQFQPAHIKVQLHELMESKKREDAKEATRKRKKKKKIKDKVVLFAEQSLKESKDLASETLAELLVAQEQYDKATKMYERLILIFPEKSTYFAEKIRNLKNK